MNDQRVEIGSLVKTAATIAAIFGAIVATFVLTMDAPAGPNIEVAMSDAGEADRQAPVPHVETNPIAVGRALQ